MNKKYLITLLVAGAGFFASCNSGDIRRNPGKVYMPDMFYSQAYDAFTTNPVTANGLTSQEPVKGTVARGHALPDHLTEEDTAAYDALEFAYQFSADEIQEGGRLYNIYCGICHGTALDGNGPLYTSGKFAAMPANLVAGDYYKFMKPGRIYHAIKYGKNMMGSYSSQIDDKERWQVIAYIKQMQAAKGGTPFTMGMEGEAKTDKKMEATENSADSTVAANVQLEDKSKK